MLLKTTNLGNDIFSQFRDGCGEENFKAALKSIHDQSSVNMSSFNANDDISSNKSSLQLNLSDQPSTDDLPQKPIQSSNAPEGITVNNNLDNKDLKLTAKLFKEMDANNDGFLSFEELKNGLANIGYVMTD